MYKLEVFYSEEDQGYIANFPDLTYCSAFGKTSKEAVREARVAIRAWLKSKGERMTEEEWKEAERQADADKSAGLWEYFDLPSMRTIVLSGGEDGWFVATVPSLKGCVSQGKTRQEASDNISDAIEAYVAALLEDGLPVPPAD